MHSMFSKGSFNLLRNFQNLNKNMKSVGKVFMVSGLFSTFNIINTFMKNQQSCKNQEKAEFLANHNQKPSHKLEWDQFSDETYEKALKDKCNVIVLVEPYDSEMEFIQEKIDEILFNVQQYQKYTRGKKLKFLKIKFKSQEEQNAFEQKYQTKITKDSFLLLKNSYIKQFYQFQLYDFMYNKEFMNKYFQKITKISPKNMVPFQQSFKELTSEQVVIFGYCDKNSENYENCKRRFNMLTLEQQFQNTNVHFLFVNDKSVIETVTGLKNISNENNVVMLLPASKNLLTPSNLTVENKQYFVAPVSKLDNLFSKIIEDIKTNFNSTNLFAYNNFQNINRRYSINVEIDKNRLSKSEYQYVLHVLTEFKKDPKNQDLVGQLNFIKRPSRLNKDKYQILLRDDEKYSQNLYQYSVKSKQELDAIKETIDIEHPHTYTMKFDDDLTPDNLIQFVKKGMNGELKEYFKSAPAPKYRKYSRKVVSKTFKQNVLDSEEDQVLFIYSKHCHFCKKYGGVYENLGLQYLVQREQKLANVEFNRMNNDNNDIDCAQNFGYSPVFQVYKKGLKNKPYLYKNQMFNQRLLTDFVRITLDLEVMDENQFQKLYENRKNPDFKIVDV